MAAGLWAALGGYALGSAQVLVIDWLRNRSQHRKQLRFLRAELLRLRGFEATFSWPAGGVPESDTVPNPPTATAGFSRLLQEIDFWLTDEHRDDNTQLALLNIVDGCRILERYSADVLAAITKAGEAETQPAKAKWRDRANGFAGSYDREHPRLMTMIDSALSDNARRLRAARFLPQLYRSLRSLPEGKNPEPLPPAVHEDM